MRNFGVLQGLTILLIMVSESFTPHFHPVFSKLLHKQIQNSVVRALVFFPAATRMHTNQTRQVFCKEYSRNYGIR